MLAMKKAILLLWVLGAWATKITLVSALHYNTVAHHVENSLGGSFNGSSIERVLPDVIDAGERFEGSDLVIAVGRSALEKMLDKGITTPILSIMVRKGEYLALMHKHHQLPGAPEFHVSALWLDQPYKRQLLLTKKVFETLGDPITVGVILGPNSKRDELVLKQAAQKWKVNLEVAHVAHDEDPINAMNHILSDAHVMLAIPDYEVFNRQTARGLLLSAYRKHVPLMGYSRATVNIGAVAALYATPKQIARQVARITKQFAVDKRLPKGQFPDEFIVAINHQVAQNLNLPAFSSQALTDWMIETWQKEVG